MPIGDTDRGLFLSVLEEISRPGQIVRNALAGRGVSAARQAGQLGVNLVDAFIPGDWLPNDLAREEDYLSGRELVGASDDVLGKALGFGVDVITDPLTYIPGGVVAKGLKGAGSLASKGVAAADKVLPGVKQTVESAGRLTRQTLGHEGRFSPETKAILQRARAARTNEAKAAIDTIGAGTLAKISDQEGDIVGDVLDNALWQDGKIVGEVGPTSLDPIKLLELHPQVTPETLPRLRDAVADAMSIGQQQAKRDNVYSKTTAPDPLLFGATTTPQTAFKGDYLPRTYRGQTQDQLVNELLGVTPEELGRPAPVAARSLKTSKDQAGFLGNEPGVTYERNAVKRLGARAEAQGVLAQRAEIGKALMGDTFEYANPTHRAQVREQIRSMAIGQPEEARAFMDAFNGLAPRGKIMETIVSLMTPFKKAAVYGVIIPKIGSIVSNKVNGIWQALSDKGSRGVALNQAGRLDGDLIGAVADTFGWTYPRDRLVADLRQINQAFAASGGLADNAVQALSRAGRDDLAGMVTNGVLDGFVSAEQMLGKMANTKWATAKKIWDWPGEIFRGVEDRMRAGMYLDLVAKGKTPAEAAQIVKDALYDYSVTSVANRTARDFLPFFQFPAKAIVQQGKFLAEKPYLASLLANATDQGDDPVYPYMEGRINVPIGEDPQGNEQYLTGLRTPFEALNLIPNPSSGIRAFGRQLEQNVVGSANPLLKSLYAATSGRDPYFGTPYGSYSKVPVAGDLGEAGRLYNQVAGTGLIQPLDSSLRTVGELVDERRSGLGKLLDTFTGANVVSVDEDRALQQQLMRALEQNPNVMRYSGLYQTANDEKTQMLLDELAAAKRRIKAKRELTSAGRE